MLSAHRLRNYRDIYSAGRKKEKWYILGCLLCVVMVLLLSACGEQPQPKLTSADGIILSMLDNIKENGYDANSVVNKGLGGLWVNWRYGTSPLQTNFNGSGAPDDPNMNPPRHDPLTDLRYVHALWLYKNLHPSDTQFDGDLQRYTAIVKQEFTHTHNSRGWLYDLFIDLYQLSKDPFYQQTARQLADYYYTHLYQPKTGLIYTNSNNGRPSASYRVDLALEAGCALIQASTVFNVPAWKDAGERVVTQLYATAYVPQYQAFLSQLSNYVLPSGELNPNPSIYRARVGHTNVEGGSVRTGTVALEVLSLLHVYSVTHDATFLKRGTDLLEPLTVENNTLGLWDSEHLGYYSAAVFKGPDHLNPGTPKLVKGSKESGRQIQLLEAFRVANSLTHNQFQSMQDVMSQIMLQRAYYSPGHGVLYQMTNDWRPIEMKNGVVQDWVTTEAMGIALEGLFSLQRPNPW